MPMKHMTGGLALGLVVGLLGAVATYVPRISELEQDFELPWLFHLRPTSLVTPEVIVVAIDEQSAQSLGLASKPSEWPRELHARLTDRLARSGAKVIAFDLTFDAPSRTPPNDVDFASAINAAGNVVLVAALRKETVQQKSDSGRHRGEIVIEKVTPPIPILEDAALAYAPFPLPKESRVDTYWTFKTGAGDSPTLPVVALQVYAFDAYRDFVSLVRRADPSLAVAPPATPRELISSANSDGIVATLRDAFLRDPRLADRVSKVLEEAGDRITPNNRRLIRSLIGVFRSPEVAYLNFYGPPRTLATIPYHEVLSADSSAKASSGTDRRFEGKAVFIGFSAFSQPEQDRVRDDYRTVFSQRDGLDISGVEIAATAFANLLDDRAVRPVPFPAHLAIVGFWGLALGAACRMLRPSVAAVLVLFLAPAYLFVGVRQFAAAGIWLPLLVPLALQAPLALFGGALLHYRDARRERKSIREAFGRFVPEKIVDRLVESVSPVDAADQLVYGACLATDVEKYTQLAETMGPRELAVLMNEYYSELFKPVVRLGGVVNEVVGDAMLAIWAASSEQASIRRHACEATLEIFEAAERFNRARPGKPALRTRFGLHSGQLLIGSIGASSHYEYQAVGDMVNTASRIEGLSKYLGTWILASEATVEGLQEFLTRPVGSFLFAGKSAPVSVVELGGSVQHPDPRLVTLYDRFARALEDYRARRWQEAVRGFSELVTAHSNDGPSRFYLRRCERYARRPPGPLWDPTIRLEHK